MLLTIGCPDVEQDQDKAIELFKASAKLGNKQALSHLISLKVMNKNEYFDITPV